MVSEWTEEQSPVTRCHGGGWGGSREDVLESYRTVKTFNFTESKMGIHRSISSRRYMIQKAVLPRLFWGLF